MKPANHMTFKEAVLGALLALGGCYQGTTPGDSHGAATWDSGAQDDDDDDSVEDGDGSGDSGGPQSDDGSGSSSTGGGDGEDGTGADVGGGDPDAGTDGGEEGGAEDDGAGGMDSGGDPVSVEVCAEAAGERMLRRLTSAQLDHTLASIFDDPNVPRAQVLTDPIVRGFKVDAHEASVRDLGAQQIMQYAERVADWAVAEKRNAIAPCQSLEPACRDEVVRTLGEKFHREPLTDEMVAAYATLMDAESEFDAALRQLIAAFIQSPYFLYRRELGVDRGGVYELTDFELASNLSYSLTAGPPDETLMNLAREGRLRDEAVLREQADRLLQTPQGQAVLAEFVHGWLEVDDLQSRVKVENNGVAFDEDLRAKMLTETAMLFQTVFNQGGTVEDLFTADYTFVDQTLGHFYRMWQANSTTVESFPIPSEGEGHRGKGLLAHGSVLARHASADNSSPVHRGVMVRRRLLCHPLPDPPSDVDTNLEPIAAGSTNRERYEQHRADPACASCHNLIDPIGFAFEHYDEYGRWRDQESGRPVDASGALSGLASDAVELDGLDDLSEALAGADEVRSCFAQYVAYYLYGSGVCDASSVAGAPDVPAGAQLRAIVDAVVTGPHFRERVED